MIKTLKAEAVMQAYNILNTATYKKLDDADKIKLWKLVRKMKPIATQMEDDSRGAAEKLKPEGLDEQLEKAKSYEAKRKDGEKDLPMTDDEYNTFIRDVWTPYSQLIANAVKEYAEKDVELDFEPLTEEAFGKLMASNDWNFSQAVIIGDLIIDK